MRARWPNKETNEDNPTVIKKEIIWKKKPC